jgi:carbon monoxide dehydrogenase subunit G
MKIDNEFTVSVPIERAWEVLTDLEGVSLCLPGARLTGVEGDVYKGEIKVKVGPVVSQYAGTAQFLEKDDAQYRAVIDAKGRDSRGAGNASALITVQLQDGGDHTAVSVDTDMKISGKIAQLGGGMIKEVSAKLLGQFVDCLEAKLAVSPSSTPAETSAPSTPAGTPAPSTSAETSAPSTPAGTPAPSTSAETPAPPTATATTSAETPALAHPAEAPPRSNPPATATEPLDLMSLAGGAMARRVIPLLVVLVLVVLVVVYFIAR